MTETQFTLMDVFSGIGGFSLAGRNVGFKTLTFVEIDPFCRAVLAKNFPGVPIENDIREFDGKPFRGRINVLCGGLPCQPFSVAGKQQGDKDERFLWPELLRVINEVRPDVCLLENVPNLRNIAADRILGDLETAGYTAGAFVVGADDIGASHRRKRVWIVADPASARLSRHPQRAGTAYALSGNRDCSLADTESDNWRLLLQSRQSREENFNTTGTLRSLPRFPPARNDYSGWATVASVDAAKMPCVESEVCRLADEFSRDVVRRRRRTRNATLKALGNSIVPAVAELFLKWIYTQLTEKEIPI